MSLVMLTVAYTVMFTVAYTVMLTVFLRRGIRNYQISWCK
jgi:hypothetical protein